MRRAIDSPIPAGRRIFAFTSHEPRRYRILRPHGTSDWLLIHSIGGCGRVVTSRGEALLPPGTAVLFAAGCAHDYGTAQGHERWLLRWAHFLPRDGWERLLAWPTPIGGPGLLAVSGDTRARLEQALDLSISASAGPWVGDEELALSALEVALRLYSRADAGNGLSIDPRVRDAMDTIATDTRLARDVPRLARIAGLSASRFAHLFRLGAGMSPGRWAELVRLRRAASLLLGSADSIARIAERVGYDDPYYFSARFRRRFGTSPRTFRGRAG